VKIIVQSDSCMQTIVRKFEGYEEFAADCIEISDEQWSEFSRIEEAYEGFLRQFSDALQAKQLEARSELDKARERVAILEAMLKMARPKAKPERVASPAQPIDETDAGNGVREVEGTGSATDFREELAALRERTREKRSRLQ
jgi:hypothetical protein